MRRGTLWLTAVMIAATSALYSPGVITVENIPISLDPSTSKSGVTGGTTEGSTTEGSTTEGSTTEGSTTEGSTTEGSTTEGSTTEGSTTEGSTTEGSTTEGSTTEGSTTEGSTTEGSTTEGSTTEGSTTEGSTTEGSTTEGSTTEGSTTEGSTTEGSTTEDSTTEGNATEGSTTEGSTTEGSTTEDSTTEGSTTEGSTTEGSTTEGSTTEDSTTPPNEYPDTNELIVKTNSGKVQGILWQDRKHIISYIDIPYGTFDTKPFEAATAAKAWKMHSALDHNKRCPQIQDNKFVGNKDCLTLSIFKPLIAENASVLFYIHGDDFKTGSGDPSIYGPDYLVSKGIILVLPNYRLGPLGFLCMQNKTAPGNMALKDLSLALRWIHENIHFFGGNPNNIVVSGDGRSGALAELLALFSPSKDYVDKVISESGSFLSHWALDRDPQSTVSDLFDRIKDAEKSIKSRISIEELDEIVKAGNEIEFKPCLEAKDDDAFITETPFATITTTKIETTFLMGSAMYAGHHEALHQTEDSIKELNEDFKLLLPNDLTFSTMTLKAEIGGRVKRLYFGDQNITLDNMRNISLYFTDVGYLSPGIRSARLLAEAGATVYFYEFSFVGESNRELESFDSSVQGAVRGDIVRYLFTQDGYVPDADDTNDAKMVDTLTKMWTNFLTEGHPATETIQWNKLENGKHEEEEWLLIDSDQPSMRKGVHLDRLPLWTDIYEEHFIDGGNHARGLTPAVLTVLVFQLVFWLVFCTNVSHVF